VLLTLSFLWDRWLGCRVESISQIRKSCFSGGHSRISRIAYEWSGRFLVLTKILQFVMIELSMQKGVEKMLRYALIFLILALIAGLFGFAGVAGVAVEIARILFFVFILFSVLSFLFGSRRR
jgi:uncharacterized membrane protein YtjA (UPF0391 family)